MYLVVKQPDGLKLQYSSHRAKVFSIVLGLWGKTGFLLSFHPR